MTFFNFFTNINISNFCSRFGGIIPPCFRNFVFTSSPLLTGFNFSMPIFNNFSMFSDFTNYSTMNNMPLNSLWNCNLTNIKPPNFSNCEWNSSNYNVGNYNFVTPNWSSCNFDTFSYTIPSNKSRSTYHSHSGFRWEYCNLSKQAALEKASKDSRLEKLTGGEKWQLSTTTFKGDIPYAKKGMSNFLNKLCTEINESLTITSALGTSDSPHSKGGGYASHYNNNNPKLDIGGGLSPSQAEALAGKLRNTGYFSRVEVETHGSTAHLDVQVKESVLIQYA